MTDQEHADRIKKIADQLALAVNEARHNAGLLVEIEQKEKSTTLYLGEYIQGGFTIKVSVSRPL